MSNPATLFGFALGGSNAPHFAEPIFVKDGKLLVQSCADQDDSVKALVDFTDEVEVIESASDEHIELGQPRLFAVRDLGERFVYGDRRFVTRYLKQNLRNYLTTPFFMVEVTNFTKSSIAETHFIQSNRDILEATVLANSVRRFCKNELREINSLDGNRVELARAFFGPPFEFSVGLASPKTNIFERWQEFAKRDAPKLTMQSKWGNISDSYLAVFEGNKRRASRYTMLYWAIARTLLEDDDSLKSLTAHEHDTPNNANLPKSIGIDPFVSKISNEFIHQSLCIGGLFKFKALVPVERESLGKRMKGIATKLARSLTTSLLSHRVSSVEISMHVFFISLVLKIGEEIKDE